MLEEIFIIFLHFFIYYLHVNERRNPRRWFVAKRCGGVLPLFEDNFFRRALLLRRWRLVLLRRRRGRRDQRGQQRDRDVPLDGAVYLERRRGAALQAAGLPAGGSGSVGFGHARQRVRSTARREVECVCERENWKVKNGGWELRFRGINRGACGAHVWNLKLKWLMRLGSARLGLS